MLMMAMRYIPLTEQHDSGDMHAELFAPPSQKKPSQQKKLRDLKKTHQSKDRHEDQQK